MVLTKATFSMMSDGIRGKRVAPAQRTARHGSSGDNTQRPRHERGDDQKLPGVLTVGGASCARVQDRQMVLGACWATCSARVEKAKVNVGCVIFGPPNLLPAGSGAGSTKKPDHGTHLFR